MATLILQLGIQWPSILLHETDSDVLGELAAEMTLWYKVPGAPARKALLA
jgi:hypothetical protein